MTVAVLVSSWTPAPTTMSEQEKTHKRTATWVYRRKASNAARAILSLCAGLALPIRGDLLQTIAAGVHAQAAITASGGLALELGNTHVAGIVRLGALLFARDR